MNTITFCKAMKIANEVVKELHKKYTSEKIFGDKTGSSKMRESANTWAALRENVRERKIMAK